MNEGALLRSAEAFGLNLIITVGKHRVRTKTSVGADKHLIFKHLETYQDLIRYIRKNNHTLVCIENIDKATYISEIPKYPRNPIFVVGNEKYGVPPDLIDAADLIVQIRQGPNYIRCLNAAVSAGIVFHDYYVKSHHRGEEALTNFVGYTEDIAEGMGLFFDGIPIVPSNFSEEIEEP